jgi:hypothetical protein
MHDCAITASYAVLLHMPLCFDGEAMVKANTLPLAFMKDRPARIGLLRCDAPGLPPVGAAAPGAMSQLPAGCGVEVCGCPCVWGSGLPADATLAPVLQRAVDSPLCPCPSPGCATAGHGRDGPQGAPRPRHVV